MHLNHLSALTSAAALLSLTSHVQAQQPFHDWKKAYDAAEQQVMTWSTEQKANISVRGGTAPDFVPFEPSDG